MQEMKEHRRIWPHLGCPVNFCTFNNNSIKVPGQEVQHDGGEYHYSAQQAEQLSKIAALAMISNIGSWATLRCCEHWCSSSVLLNLFDWLFCCYLGNNIECIQKQYTCRKSESTICLACPTDGDIWIQKFLYSSYMTKKAIKKWYKTLKGEKSRPQIEACKEHTHLSGKLSHPALNRILSPIVAIATYGRGVVEVSDLWFNNPPANL